MKNDEKEIYYEGECIKKDGQLIREGQGKLMVGDYCHYVGEWKNNWPDG